MMNQTFLYGIPGSTVKLIAMACMFIDHFAVIFLEMNHPVLSSFLRSIGRIAFPLFAFLLTEGFLHTHSKVNYCRNLFIMAILSEIPFDLAFHNSVFDPISQNTLFTLTIGLLTIWAISLIEETTQKKGQKQYFRIPLTLLVTAAGSFAAWLFRSDYEFYGILAIVLLYVLRTRRMAASVLSCAVLTLIGPAESFCFFSIPLIMKYNGSRGLKLKYAFYLFYPFHLLVLYLLWHTISI